MALGTSPRKVVPLAPGDDWESRPKTLNLNTGPTVTKRAFFCAVVVEGPNDGEDLSEDVQDLVASLGDTIVNEHERDQEDAALSPNERPLPSLPRKTDASVFADSIDELVATERSYVKKLHILKESYADPLRSYARSKETAIIPPYEANILFGNIDQLVPVNEAFLRDLEVMISTDGENKVGGIGDVALKHFKTLKAFDCYKRYYTKREEAQAIFKREMEKKSSTGFAAFVERVKYATTDVRNRVGLRELLMEPVQRIPRYTLLFSAMLANMPNSDPQRAKLAEANEHAAGIALAETDDHTKLAATMYRLSVAVDGFPPGLISSGRRFVDCVDVEDRWGEGGEGDGEMVTAMSSSSNLLATPGASSSSSNALLHCTLFLFNDKLVIAKRNNAEKSGRALAGLDDGDKIAIGGSGGFGFSFGRNAFKKGSMVCKGVVDITEVVATDVAGSDIHLYLENPPQDSSERWSNRPLRVLTVVHSPSSSAHDLLRSRAEASKKRFLENLWRAQALYRTRAGGSVALVSQDQEVESRGGKVQIARMYWNVYQRTMFLKETRKSKIVLHIDSEGNADPLPFGVNKLTAPFVIVRVQSIHGERCHMKVTSSDPDEEPEEEDVQISQVPGRVSQLIHQYGLFKFKTNNLSRPATPSSGFRSRAHIFGLDVISRNLFGAVAGSSRGGDPFGSIGINSSFRHRRTKSAIGRDTSMIGAHRSGTVNTMSTTGSDSFTTTTKFSSRSNSTAATSVSNGLSPEESSFLGRSMSKPRKLLKRGSSKSKSRSRSPSVRDVSATSETESPLARQSTTSSRNSRTSATKGSTNGRRRSRSVPIMDTDLTLDYSDPEDNSIHDINERARAMNASERDLARNLELARRNSRNQRHGIMREPPYDGPVEESIYEEGPPMPTRPASQASYFYSDTEPVSLSSNSPPHSRLTTPTPTGDSSSSRKGRSNSTSSRRPLGPRAPSPLPPSRLDLSDSISASDIERALETTLNNLGQGQSRIEFPTTPTRVDQPSQLPRSRRLPFIPTGNTESTPRGAANGFVFGEGTKTPTAIEPLSIKKKTSNAGATRHKSPTTRRTYSTDSPLSHSSSRANRVSANALDRAGSMSSTRSHEVEETVENIQRLAETTREDLFSSRRALKRIKLEINSLPSKLSSKDISTHSDTEARSPALRNIALSPGRQPPANKEALKRMEEMRQMIGRRGGVESSIPRRPQSVILGSSFGSSSGGNMSSSSSLEWTKQLEDLVSEAEGDVARAAGNHERLEKELHMVTTRLEESSLQAKQSARELGNARGQCELMKQLLSDATAENELLYQSFNEELDGMFNDANLPQDEAWNAMTADLRTTKEERNSLLQENSQLKRRLQEAEMQREQWEHLLRTHGLIP